MEDREALLSQLGALDQRILPDELEAFLLAAEFIAVKRLTHCVRQLSARPGSPQSVFFFVRLPARLAGSRLLEPLLNFFRELRTQTLFCIQECRSSAQTLSLLERYEFALYVDDLDALSIAERSLYRSRARLTAIAISALRALLPVGHPAVSDVADVLRSVSLPGLPLMISGVDHEAQLTFLQQLRSVAQTLSLPLLATGHWITCEPALWEQFTLHENSPFFFSPTLLPGQKVHSSFIEGYQVLRPLSRGGMADAFLAEDATQRRCVVKLMRPELLNAPSFFEQFRAEVLALRRLRHDNVSQFLDCGFLGTSQRPWLATHHIEGISLTKLVLAGTLDPARLVRIMGQLLDALIHIHAHAIVHGDITPNNIIIANAGTRAERAVIIDFGLAVLGYASHSVAGGTPGFMSPEQAVGHTPSTSSDLYSLGCVLHFMLLGKPPISGNDPFRTPLTSVEPSAPEPASLSTLASDIPPELLSLLTRLLYVEPSERMTAVQAREALIPIASLSALNPQASVSSL